MSSDSLTREGLLSQNNHLRTPPKQIQERFKLLFYRPGVLTRNYLLAAGFRYTGDGDTARCEDCGLEMSNWTADMIPFTIHSERSPHCAFVRSKKTPLLSSNVSVSNVQETISERPDAEPVDADQSPNSFLESIQLKRVRERTFSHWPHRTTPSSAQMVEAGFFNCNVGDLVICIYCNLICQQWTPNVDDPCEVHRTLSPDCIYTKALLTYHGPLFIINENGNLLAPDTGRPALALNNINSLSMSGFVRRAVQNNSVQNDQPASIDDDIQANYFNTDKKSMVTCSHCRKSFRNLDSNEDPMIDHIRRFPCCPYVQQLQGTAMYRQIHGSNARQQNSGPSLTFDEKMISRMVAARLDLPVSQTLLNRNYSLSIVKQCWEDQLRLKEEDFVSDLDLKVACLVLQKRSEQFHDGRNVIIPSERMREREIQAQAELIAQIRAASTNRTAGSNDPQGHPISLEAIDSCVVCWLEEKALAFLPCGHFVTCVPCGYSLHLCPLCRGKKEAVVRVHI